MFLAKDLRPFSSLPGCFRILKAANYSLKNLLLDTLVHIPPGLRVAVRLAMNMLRVFPLQVLIRDHRHPARRQLATEVGLVRLEKSQPMQRAQTARTQRLIDQQLLPTRHVVQVYRARDLVQDRLLHDRAHVGRDEEHAVSPRVRADLVYSVAIGHRDELLIERVARRAELGDHLTLGRVDNADGAVLVEERDVPEVVLVVEGGDGNGQHGDNVAVHVKLVVAAENELCEVEAGA